jgi:alkylhydroperoxidase family enzyme
MTLPVSFLAEPAPSPEVQAKYDADLSSYGFVMNLSHVWAHLPDAHTRLFDLLGVVGSAFSFRERAILVTAMASTIGDSYCSYAWGWKLSEAEGEAVSTGVLAGTDADLTPKEAALAAWARTVARDAGSTSEADVQHLRQAGWTDEEIFRATTFVALRMAFSTVNGALGARPDRELLDRAGPAVAETVTWGRPVEEPEQGRTVG